MPRELPPAAVGTRSSARVQGKPAPTSSIANRNELDYDGKCDSKDSMIKNEEEEERPATPPRDVREDHIAFDDWELIVGNPPQFETIKYVDLPTGPSIEQYQKERTIFKVTAFGKSTHHIYLLPTMINVHGLADMFTFSVPWDLLNLAEDEDWFHSLQTWRKTLTVEDIVLVNQTLYGTPMNAEDGSHEFTLARAIIGSAYDECLEMFSIRYVDTGVKDIVCMKRVYPTTPIAERLAPSGIWTEFPFEKSKDEENFLSTTLASIKRFMASTEVVISGHKANSIYLDCINSPGPKRMLMNDVIDELCTWGWEAACVENTNESHVLNLDSSFRKKLDYKTIMDLHADRFRSSKRKVKVVKMKIHSDGDLFLTCKFLDDEALDHDQKILSSQLSKYYDTITNGIKLHRPPSNNEVFAVKIRRKDAESSTCEKSEKWYRAHSLTGNQVFAVDSNRSWKCTSSFYFREIEMRRLHSSFDGVPFKYFSVRVAEILDWKTFKPELRNFLKCNHRTLHLELGYGLFYDDKGCFSYNANILDIDVPRSESYQLMRRNLDVVNLENFL